MEKRFLQLVHRTGASGDLTEIDTLILKVMKSDKQISGDTVASSSKPEIEIRGNIIVNSISKVGGCITLI